MSTIRRIALSAGFVAGLLSLNACSGVSTSAPMVNKDSVSSLVAPSGGAGSLFTDGKGNPSNRGVESTVHTA